MDYLEFNEEQSREATDAYQIHIAYEDAKERLDKYQGAMSWKTVSGHEYLYRKKTSAGEWKSLGAKSEESERKYVAFMEGKAVVKERMASIKAQMDLRARFAKAARINRVPVVVAKIARALNDAGILGAVSIVGTNAIYGYEALSGVHIVPRLMATRDVDFLWDNRIKIDLAVESEINGFLSILKKADRSFERSKQLFRAINKDGYMADLIVPEPKNPMQSRHEQMGNEYDLKASGIGSLRWLVNSPKVEAVAIDKQGYPFRMVMPDPRAFAIHKLWVSEQANRKPEKAERDYQQAVAIAELIVERLPQYKFEVNQLKMFPKEVAEKGIDEVSRIARLRAKRDG